MPILTTQIFIMQIS